MFGFARIRSTELLFFARALILTLFILVGAIEDRTVSTTIQRSTVHHIRIFLIVARVGHNSYNNILTRRQVLCTIKLAHEGRYHRNFRVAEDMTHCIKSLTEIQGVYTHCLFCHGRLVCITRRLIMVRKGNAASSGSKD